MSTQISNGRGIGPALALVVFLLPLPFNDAYAGGRRRVVAVSPPSSGPELTFVDALPFVDAGTIAWQGGPKRASVSRRTVTLRIGEASREPSGTATVRAFVETFDARCTIRVDGVALTTAPQVVRRNAPVGIAFTHRIDVEVPAAAAEGPLQATIGWEVTTD
jgi:hypothetical protein